jgi:hypothetical protein
MSIFEPLKLTKHVHMYMFLLEHWLVESFACALIRELGIVGQ